MNDKDALNNSIESCKGYTYIPDFLGVVFHLDSTSQIILGKIMALSPYTGDYDKLALTAGVGSRSTIQHKIDDLVNEGHIVRYTFFVQGTRLRTVLVSRRDNQGRERDPHEIEELIQRGRQKIIEHYIGEASKNAKKKSKKKSGDISLSSIDNNNMSDL